MCNTRHVRRLAGLVLLLATIGVVGVVTYAIRERRVWAERWALSVAEEWGVGPVSLEVAELDHEGARIRRLEVGDPVTLSIDQLDFTWTPTEIGQLQIAQLALTGVHLRASITQDGALSFGALDPALEGESDGTLMLPREVTFSDARVDFATPLGAVSLDGIGGRVLPAAAGLGSGELEARLSDPATPQRFPPLRLEVRAASTGKDGITFDFGAETEDGGVHVSGAGSFAPESRTGELELTLAPVALGPEAVNLAKLAPAFASQLPTARGGISGHVKVRLRDEEKAPYSLSGELNLDGLDLERSETRLEGLDGKIRFAGPDPWHTPGKQELRFALLDLVGALHDGAIRFEARGTEVQLTSFEAGWAGGQVAIRGRFDVMNREGTMTVEVTQVDLEHLLNELDIADLSGTGRISGAMPLVLSGDELRVNAALAASPAGGLIRWRPAAGAAKRLGLTGDLAVVADALEDYHYEELKVGLEGDLAGDVVMQLGLKGSNPAYESGRPVHLDLQVETNVPATLLASRAATRIPEALERRLRERVSRR